MTDKKGPDFMRQQAAGQADAQVKEKLDRYRQQALAGDDAVFDSQRMVFLFHGKHRALAGVDAVIEIDVASLLLAMSVVQQNTIVPMLMAMRKQQASAVGAPTQVVT